jgi:hypothetical protein
VTNEVGLGVVVLVVVSDEVVVDPVRMAAV